MILTNLETGRCAVVTGLTGERLQKMKLLDLGLTPGTRVCVQKIAPMGDPIEIAVRSYVLTLRKDEAALVGVEPMVELRGNCGSCASCAAGVSRG